MPLDEIVTIAQAEQKAQGLKDDALLLAKKIRSDASEKGRTDYEAAIRNAQGEADSLLADAVQADSEDFRQLIDSQKSEEQDLRAKAAENMDNAVRIIIERIVNV